MGDGHVRDRELLAVMVRTLGVASMARVLGYLTLAVLAGYGSDRATFLRWPGASVGSKYLVVKDIERVRRELRLAHPDAVVGEEDPILWALTAVPVGS